MTALTVTDHRPERDPGPFRDVLANHPSGVTIVTAADPQTLEPSGLVVTAFSSVSADPPMVLVCLDQGSVTLATIQRSGSFTVNFLASGREPLVSLFSSKRSDKFGDVQWHFPAAGGGPVLIDDVCGYLACVLVDEITVGDHRLCLGRVEEVQYLPDRAPLVYHQRGFTSVG